MTLASLASFARTSWPAEALRVGTAHAGSAIHADQESYLFTGFHAHVVALPVLSAEVARRASTVYRWVTWSSSAVVRLRARHEQQSRHPPPRRVHSSTTCSFALAGIALHQKLGSLMSPGRTDQALWSRSVLRSRDG